MREPIPLPTYHERYCAFVDILGFRELITSLNNDADGSALLELRAVLNEVHSPTALVAEEGTDFRAQSMSDAICISTSCTAPGLYRLFVVLEKISLSLLVKGYFVRGAVVKGRLYHDTSLVFGEAQARAYQLETEVVKYPRIMIESAVVNDTIKFNVLQGSTLQAADGPQFLHILRRMYSIRDLNLSEDAREALRLTYELMAKAVQGRFDASFDTPRHFEKVQWFARYWNTHAYLNGVPLIMRRTYDGVQMMMV